MELTFEGILQTHGDKPEKIFGLEASKLKLTSICPLHPFTKLKSINLASNLIESLSNSQIDRLRDLKDLDVSCNSLKSTSGILNPGLVRLNLGFNKLEYLESLPKSLHTLRAEGNLIQSTRSLSSLNSLKILDLNLNEIHQIEGLERLQLEELYLSHNQIREILPSDLPNTLKVLNLRKNQISSVKFLSKVPSLESLNLEDNKLETLSGFPVLPNLTELILSNNFIFLLELSRDINELLPSLFVLDLSFNSLYDRAELIPLNQITSLHELSLENNPCSENPDIIQVLSRDYPNISIINNVQIKDDSRPASRSKNFAQFEDSRLRRELQEMNDLVLQKRKQCLGLLKDIEHTLEKQFYDEFGLLQNTTFEPGELYVVQEDQADDHEDLEEEEQKWFTTQMQWTRKVSERKGASHRYIKDCNNERPSTSAPSQPVQIKGNRLPTDKVPNKYRKKLEEARKFLNS